MADNVGYTEGSGTQVTSREVTYSGDLAKMQVVGLATLSGADDAKVPTDISPTAPLPVAVYGELIEAIESMRMAVNALTQSIGFALPNAQGFPIMEVRQATAANLAVSVSNATIQSGNLTTLTTLSTLTNQSQVGGFSANDQIPALMHMQADSLRRNISVT